MLKKEEQVFILHKETYFRLWILILLEIQETEDFKPRFCEIFPTALLLWQLVMTHLNEFNLKLFFITALLIPLYHQLLMLLCYVPHCHSLQGLPYPPGTIRDKIQ